MPFCFIARPYRKNEINNGDCIINYTIFNKKINMSLKTQPPPTPRKAQISQISIQGMPSQAKTKASKCCENGRYSQGEWAHYRSITVITGLIAVVD